MSIPPFVSKKAVVISLLALSGLVQLTTLNNIDVSHYKRPADNTDTAITTLGNSEEEREPEVPEYPASGDDGFEEHHLLSTIITENSSHLRSHSMDYTIVDEDSLHRPQVNEDDMFDPTRLRLRGRWINKTIREWGCHRTEMPLIFIHIGKAGGGMIRARFAAAAMDYNRTNWHEPHKDEHYYYPVQDGSVDNNKNTMSKAKFCNSKYHSFDVPNSKFWKNSFEGNRPCIATTPIGMALACPETLEERGRCLGCGDWQSKDCHTVYVGHNKLGSELHWLPSTYLQNWWHSTSWGSYNSNLTTTDWRRIYEGKHETGSGSSAHATRPPLRPDSFPNFDDVFQERSITIGDSWETKFQDFWRRSQVTSSSEVPPDEFSDGNSNVWIPLNYSPLYASLPVQRVTLVREPWAWLVTKFFWHHGVRSVRKCDDWNYIPEWTHEYALQFIAYLCGGDCGIRYERNQTTLEELWIQSESNLRHAFSVVGLMNETMTFYDMLSTRVAFLDMSRNPHVEGKLHRSGRSQETERCRRLFTEDADFQMALRNRVPAVHVVERLYHVAVEVNRFQLQELRGCQGPQGILSTINFSVESDEVEDVDSQ